MPTYPYAEVAVAALARRSRPGPVRGVPPRLATFHYSFRPALADAVVPGALVWVPFGRRRQMGVVVAMHARSPVEHTRDILAIVGAEAPLSLDLVLLGRWMSAYYMAPLFECLAAMLPPGGLAHEVEVFRRTKKPILVTEHSPASLRVLGTFAGGKSLTPAEVGRAAKVKGPEDYLAELAAGGMIVRELRREGRSVAHKRLHYLSLADGASDRAWTVLRQAKGTARSDVVASLAEAGGELPVGAVLEAVGCGRTVITRLAEIGVVELIRDSEAGPEQAPASGGGPSRRKRRAESVRLVAPGDAKSTEAQLRGIAGHLQVVDYLALAATNVLETDLRAALGVSGSVLDDLVEAGLAERHDRITWRDPLVGKDLDRRDAPQLSADQERAWTAISTALSMAGPDPEALDPEAPGRGRRYPVVPLPDPRQPPRASAGGITSPPVVLLHGVTGSGKTELYLRAIEATLDSGGSAIVLVPEIALAPQTVQRVAGRFPSQVGLWHSELTDGERLDTWERAKRGAVRVVVGSRSAVFAPVQDLRLIVLDEEHADSYKQVATPRYNAREVAIVRARYAGAAVVLGTATPAIETNWHAERGRFHKVVLPRRIYTAAPAQRAGGRPRGPAVTTATAGATAEYGRLPPVSIVDMRRELRTGNTSMFSRALSDAIIDAIAARRQVILFLNRRGSATFVQCRDCGAIAECPRCRLPLTYHGARQRLACHHCGHREPPPMMCRQCGSHRIRYFGAGTQKVAEEAAAAFPKAHVIRWDTDTTRGRGRHEAILATFASGGADILVGTQMIAKGLDLPQVAVVGVVSADTTLALPDFRASERTFEVLTQVAGRSGRSAAGGRVVLQTYRPEEPAIRFAAGHDYDGFYEHEIAFRGEQLYPPFSQLVRLELQATADAAARQGAEKLAFQLSERTRQMGLADTEVVGPAPCFFAKVRGKFRWQVVVRSPRPHALLGDFALGPGWRIDVDPTSLL